MIRAATYILAGLVLAGIVHISIIFLMPSQSTRNAWQVIDNLGFKNQINVLDPKIVENWAQLGLDPAFVYATCQIDLSNGPVALSGQIPSSFWTASLIAKDGAVPYSTTSRTNSDRDLNIAVFNPAQARQLANAEFELASNLLIVKIPQDEYIAIIRALPTHRAQIKTYRQKLSEVSCAELQ